MTEPSDQESRKKLARTLLEQGVSIEEAMAKSGLSKPACQGLKGVLVKAQKRLNTRSEPTEAISKPEIQIQAEDELDTEPYQIGGEAEVGVVSHPSPTSSSPSSLDEKPQYIVRDGSAFIHWDTASAIAFRESLPNPQKKLFDGYLALGQKSWKDQIQNHNGHGSSVSYEPKDSVKEAKARIYTVYADWMEQQAIENMADKMRNPKGATEKGEQLGVKEIIEIMKLLLGGKGEQQLGVKDLVEVSKLFAGSSMKETLGVVDYITQAKEKGQSITLNEIALKLEEMKQTGHLDDRRLDFELLKWEKQQEGEANKWELLKDGIKTISSGPIGKMIENYGGAKAEQVRNQGARIKTVDVPCPTCKNKFKVNPELLTVSCPFCGSQLSKQPSQQAVPETPPTEPQPSPEETQQETEQPQESGLEKLIKKTKEEVM